MAKQLLTLKERLAQGIAKQGAPEVAPQAPETGGFLGNMIGNIPSSAAQFGSDMAQPFIHPIDTATSMGKLGLGVLQKLVPGKQEYEAHADAVGKFFSERYGGWDAIVNTIEKDPVGALGDLSMILSGGGTAAARMPGVFGKAGKVMQDAGRLSDPLSIGGNIAKRVAEPIASNVVGKLSGTGAEPLREAARAGFEGGDASKALTKNMRGHASANDLVIKARLAVSSMRKDKNAQYKADMSNLSKDAQILDFGAVERAVGDVAEIGMYKGQSIKPTTTKVMDEVREAVGEWGKLDPSEFRTPEGLDALKQKIGNIADAYEYNSQPRLVADQVYQSIKEVITSQAPDYAKMMERYSEASDAIKEVERALSLGKKASIDTAVRKLTSVMRNNVNTNFGNRLAQAKKLEVAGGTPLMPSLAGQALNSAMPRGLAGSGTQMGLGLAAGQYLHPAFWGTLPLSSPRLMGEVAHLGGQGAGLLNKFGPTRARAAGRAAVQTGRIQDPMNRR